MSHERSSSLPFRKQTLSEGRRSEMELCYLAVPAQTVLPVR